MQKYRRQIEQELNEEGKLDPKRSHVLMRTETEIEEERDSIHDPFYRFGLGIYTYIKLQRSLIIYLTFMSIIAVMQMAMFNGDLSNINKDLMSKESTKLTPIESLVSYFTLGSYYQAYPLCHDVPIETNSMQLECRGDM